MTENIFPPWLCANCGYMMDRAAGAFDREAVPRENDVATCLNCGYLHVLHNHHWCPITPRERDLLGPKTKALLKKLEKERKAFGFPDLRKDEGHV